MNILYLCADRGIPVRGHKGAAVHVRAMTAAFARLGHTVSLMTPRPGPAGGPELAAQLIHVPLPERPQQIGEEGEARELQVQAYRHVLYEAALTLVSGGEFRAIYERYSLWSDVGARLAQQTGIPLILEVNAPLRQEASRFRSLSDDALAAEIETVQLTGAEAVSVVSDELRCYVIGRGAAPSRVHVLPNGVDPAHFHPAVRGGSIRQAYDLHEAIVVGFVGRPRPWHDSDTLLRAMHLLRAADHRYHLLLVGQMPENFEVRLAALGLAEATTLTGPVPHHDVPRHIAAMDVAVSPHMALQGFYFSPLKLFEYMACGVPTVAADLGQPSQIIRDGHTGIVYPPGDAEVLAQRIRALVGVPARARQIAWQGASRVLQNFTWDINAQRIVERLLSRSGNGQDSGTSLQGRRPSPPEDGGIQLPLLDRKLRQRLYRATRPDLARPFLARHLPAFGKHGPERLKRVGQIEVLKYKPGRRCVLAYELEGRGKAKKLRSRHQVIGKVFRDHRGERLHRLQQWLWEHGFGPDAADGIQVPRPLAYVPEMRMQVQARAPGLTLNELVLRQDICWEVSRTAQGLAKLHCTGAAQESNEHHPPEMRTYFLGDELVSLERFAAHIVSLRPQRQIEVTGLVDILFSWAERLPSLPVPTPVHRDFYYSQVLFDEQRLTLIDFDLYALGDPAIDVANFTAHLHFLGLDKLSGLDALEAEVELFNTSYPHFRPVDAGFWQRVAFYQGATFFRLMHVVVQRPGLAHHFDTLLQRTAVCLNQGCSAAFLEKAPEKMLSVSQ